MPSFLIAAAVVLVGQVSQAMPTNAEFCRNWQSAQQSWIQRHKQLEGKFKGGDDLDSTYSDPQLLAIAKRINLLQQELEQMYPAEFRNQSGGILHGGKDGLVSWSDVTRVVKNHCTMEVFGLTPEL